MSRQIGLGAQNAKISVYIGNRPDFENLLQLTSIRTLQANDIRNIGQSCGNGWRKVFNVYAKFLYALSNRWSGETFNRWQDLRDLYLLQAHSCTNLLFSTPNMESDEKVHLVMGKHYGMSLSLPTSLRWLDNEFAIDQENRLIICPYFDYRQLSNVKIIRLVDLIKQHNWL